MAKALVELQNLSVRFRSRRGIEAALSKAPVYITAVDEVTTSIRPGEIYGLVGESGSGKTTLGKTVLRLIEPTEGTVHFRGRDISRLGDRALRSIRRELQMVFQDPLSSLNPRHRVRDALATPLRLHGFAQGRAIEREVDQILERVGLSSVFRDRFPHELSGGQLQRVAIGRALTMQPSLLVADEAVSKLDVSVRSQILNLFKEIQTEMNMTMIFITHDLHVARFLCDRIGVMYFGKLVELGPTNEIYDAPRHPYTKALLETLAESGWSDTERQSLAGEAFNPAADERIGCRFYKRCWLRQARCAEAHPATEQIKPERFVACYEWQTLASDGSVERTHQDSLRSVGSS